MTAGLVIIGASYAGVHIAAAARQNGYQEPITLIGEEPETPYERPPLSKAYLAGKVADHELLQRSPNFYRDSRVELALGAPAVAVNRRDRLVHTADGGTYPFDRLAFASGSRARPLAVPGAELEGVFLLRTLDDARRLRTAMAAAEHAVVIGGGYIGLEVTASLATSGTKVTVLEAADTLLARVATPMLAGFIASVHRSHGVEVLLETQATVLIGEAGRVRAVDCTDGIRRHADIVVIGIGALPNGDVAVSAGVVCDRSAIVIDPCGRTNEPGVVAAGDCACVSDGTGTLRLESIQNATDQGKAAGMTVAGKPKPLDVVPWFWSDQYDLRLQIAGLTTGYDSYVTRGRPEDGRFSLFYFAAGRLLAVDSINRPADHMAARKLLAVHAAITPDEAQDESTDLRTVVTRARS